MTDLNPESLRRAAEALCRAMGDDWKREGPRGLYKAYGAPAQDTIRAFLAAEAEQWQPIATAPTDGTMVWVYVAAYEDLHDFQCAGAYHPEGGWCFDELREATHWLPLDAVKRPPPVAKDPNP